MFFFFLMIRRPPRSTPFPTRRSSDLRRPRRVPAALSLSQDAARRHCLVRLLLSQRPSRDERALLGDQRERRVPLPRAGRSEEHTSELQSLAYLVCRLLLEKKKIDELV